LLLAFLLGCGDEICLRHSDCVAGEVCAANGVCAMAPADGGVDATENDASDPDAGSDAGVDAPSDATTDGGS